MLSPATDTVRNASARRLQGAKAHAIEHSDASCIPKKVIARGAGERGLDGRDALRLVSRLLRNNATGAGASKRLGRHPAARITVNASMVYEERALHVARPWLLRRGCRHGTARAPRHCGTHGAVGGSGLA